MYSELIDKLTRLAQLAGIESVQSNGTPCALVNHQLTRYLVEAHYSGMINLIAIQVSVVNQGVIKSPTLNLGGMYAIDYELDGVRVLGSKVPEFCEGFSFNANLSRVLSRDARTHISLRPPLAESTLPPTSQWISIRAVPECIKPEIINTIKAYLDGKLDLYHSYDGCYQVRTK